MASKNTHTFVTDDPDLNAQRHKTHSPTQHQQQQQQQQTGQQFGTQNVNTPPTNPPTGTQPLIRPGILGTNGQQPQQGEAARVLLLQQQINRQEQELGQFRAIEAARGLQQPAQLRGPPPDVDDLIAWLNRACLPPAPAPAPADTHVTPKLFTADQETNSVHTSKQHRGFNIDYQCRHDYGQSNICRTAASRPPGGTSCQIQQYNGTVENTQHTKNPKK